MSKLPTPHGHAHSDRVIGLNRCCSTGTGTGTGTGMLPVPHRATPGCVALTHENLL